MTTISAKIITDSVGPTGKRITTMQLKYPRFIHAEFMTHRVFSRNASSSRAIPVKKMIENIMEDTAMPTHWGRNQPGMQADEEHNAIISSTEYEGLYYTREDLWFVARDNAIDIAQKFDNAGYHKQIVNRILEPFMHIGVIVTATEWDNFYALRDHRAAQPEIRKLAIAMRAAHNNSIPKRLIADEWHLPYITDRDRENYAVDLLKKISTARCARVSYLTHEGKVPSIDADMKLYDQLITSVPAHASPCEHQATPLMSGSSGNFVGWKQHRQELGI